jgi:hypothetical protein
MGIVDVGAYVAAITLPVWAHPVFGFKWAVVLGLAVIALQPRSDFY